jgi:hypothetical protein
MEKRRFVNVQIRRPHAGRAVRMTDSAPDQVPDFNAGSSPSFHQFWLA